MKNNLFQTIAVLIYTNYCTMFRLARTVVASNASSLVAKSANVPSRTFFGMFLKKDDKIHGDIDQQSGRRRVEMDLEAKGIVS